MNNKEYLWHRQGMVYAYGKIKENGFEEFAKEMKRRGLLKIDIPVSDEEVRNVFRKMSDNMMNNMLPLFYSKLVDDFGFDKEKLNKLHEGFMKEFSNIMNLDYMGEHYVSLTDYQKYMNEEYGFDFDMEIGKECQRCADEEAGSYHFIKAEALIERLEREGMNKTALDIKKIISEG